MQIPYLQNDSPLPNILQLRLDHEPELAVLAGRQVTSLRADTQKRQRNKLIELPKRPDLGHLRLGLARRRRVRRLRVRDGNAKRVVAFLLQIEAQDLLHCVAGAEGAAVGAASRLAGLVRVLQLQRLARRAAARRLHLRLHLHVAHRLGRRRQRAAVLAVGA